MCGRFGMFDGIDDLARRFNLSPAVMPEYSPRWNIAPAMPILALAAGDVVRNVRWGIPGHRDRRPLFKARGETVHRLPTFRRGRCLIPAGGFYEWQRLPGGFRSPVWVYRAGERLFVFAGIIGGQFVLAAAINTTEANSLLAPIHHRMPVIMEPEDYEQWLTCDIHNPGLRELMLPREWPSLALRTISNTVNRADIDGRGCWGTAQKVCRRRRSGSCEKTPLIYRNPSPNNLRHLRKLACGSVSAWASLIRSL